MKSTEKQNYGVWIVVFTLLFGNISSPLWAYFHEVAKLVPPDASPGDFFGESVSTSGNYAIVGIPMDDDDGTNSGSACIYQTDGTTWTFMHKITASDAAAGHRFGQRVSMDGFYAIVGAPNAQGNEPNTGAAYVFYRQLKFVPPDSFILVWEQKAKLIASDGQGGDLFGHAVAINDKYAVVAAPFAETHEGRDGAVYIFSRDGQTWTEEAKITDPVPDILDSIFALSLSLWDNAVMIGEWYEGDCIVYTVTSGQAHIFRRRLVFIPPDNFVWRWLLENTLDGGNSGDGFGYSVAMDENFAIAGAPLYEHAGIYPNFWLGTWEAFYTEDFESGTVITFQNNAGAWSAMSQSSISQQVVYGDGVGQAVSLYGDYIVVGAPIYDVNDSHNTGAAYILKRFGSTWELFRRLTASDYQQYDHFGRSVSISRDYILVGAPLKRVMGQIIGAAYVFKVCPITDLNYDCTTNFKDLAIFSSEWLR